MTQPELLPAPEVGEQPDVRCERCRRTLTDPRSRLHRRGPDCRGEQYARRTWAITQEQLPGLNVRPAP